MREAKEVFQRQVGRPTAVKTEAGDDEPGGAPQD
jgi:hypothetical protein